MPKEVKQWITVKGNRVPIFEGESKADAIKRMVNRQKKSDKTIKKEEAIDKIAKQQHVSKKTAEEIYKQYSSKQRKEFENEKDEDTKEKQIARNKKEADERNGKTLSKEDTEKVKVSYSYGDFGRYNPDAAKKRIKEVIKDEKVKNLISAANKDWKSGKTYSTKEGEFEIGYEIDPFYNIYQTSDGKVFDGSRVQRRVEGEDSGKYHAWNNNEQLLITSSAKKAARFAWGTPRSEGAKLKKSSR